MSNEPSTIISYEVSSSDKSIGIHRGGLFLSRNIPRNDRRPAIDNVPMIPLQESGVTMEQVYQNGRQSGELCIGTEDGREVNILTDRRCSQQGFNYVGLIDGGSCPGDEIVECWNSNGNPESDDEKNQLYLFPQEMRGFIGIWQCHTTPVLNTPDQVLTNLKGSYGSDIDLKDVFVVPVYWCANPNQENVPV